MQLIRRIALLVFFIAISVIFAGCGVKSISVANVLGRGSISPSSISGMKVEIRFLKESKGSNYKYADVSGDDGFVKQLLEGLSACKAAPKPEDARFSPEMKSDCEIVLMKDGQEAVSFYYMYQLNLLIYPEWKKDKSGDSLRYLYYSADDAFAALLKGQQQSAQMKQETAVKPFRSIEELKSSIDAGELQEEGTELDFEFFSEALPQNDGTACCVYTSKDVEAVPEDSVLIAAYGRTKAGAQQKLSILGMEANTNYTKILVAEPDSALDSVDTGEVTPDSYAVVVKKSNIDPAKWIVFVDGNNSILDVIVPDDIGGLSVQPSADGNLNSSPSAGIAPDEADSATPTASANEIGPGD